MSDPYSTEALVNKYVETEKPLPEQELAYLCAFLKPTMRICDVGFGSGGLLHQLQESDYKHLCGIDSSILFVQHARKRFGSSIEVLHYDLTKTPRLHLSFDAVVAYHFLTAIQEENDRIKAFDAVAGIVGSDGILITKSFLSSVDKTVNSTQVGINLKIWIPKNKDFLQAICSIGFKLLDSTTIDRDGFTQVINVFQKIIRK